MPVEVANVCVVRGQTTLFENRVAQPLLTFDNTFLGRFPLNSFIELDGYCAIANRNSCSSFDASKAWLPLAANDRYARLSCLRSQKLSVSSRRNRPLPFHICKVDCFRPAIQRHPALPAHLVLRATCQNDRLGHNGRPRWDSES